GPAIQFAEAESYPSGGRGGLAAKPHAEIITDRNLYRPGQTVKMKGIVRNVSDSGLAIPTATDAQWRVMEGDGGRVIGEGNVALSSYGGWEAEWNVPEKAKLGHYIIDCRVSGKDYDGSTRISIEEYRVPLFSVVVEAKPEVGQTAHAHVSSAYFHGAPNVGARIHWKANWTVTAEFGSDSENNQYKKRYNAFAEIGPRLDPQTEETKTIEGDAKLDEHGFATLSCESPFKDNAAIGRANVSWRAEVTSLDGQTIVG
ncbi:MAG: hypothetical protein DME81_01095, partial [Verrucomicrobia bacterium]